MREAYAALRGRFLLTVPIGLPSYGRGELQVAQRYGSRNGVVSMEVHESPDSRTVWVAVPRGRRTPGHPRVYAWYEFRREAPGRFRSVPNPLLESTPYPGPNRSPLVVDFLTRSGRWSHNEHFSPFSATPHWPAILSQFGFSRDQYTRLHELMQDDATLPDAIRLLDSAAPPRRVDLRHRARSAWIPVTLRGFVTSAHIAGGDYLPHHTTGFVHDGEIGFGSIFPGESTDKNWAGQDWLVHVTPDPDVRYLVGISKSDRSFDVETEISQLALRLRPLREAPACGVGFGVAPLNAFLPCEAPPDDGNPYRHRPGEWIQMTGRWVIDAGHSVNYEESSEPLKATLRRVYGRDAYFRVDSDFNTEIHPWELSVSSTTIGDVTQAKVLATGAWMGEDLTFVVYPPARPSANARLRYRIHKADGSDGFDELIGAHLDPMPWPSGNPNHIVFRLVSDHPAQVLLHESGSGTVGMRQERSVHAIIDAWWETADVETRIAGRVVASGGAAPNTRLLIKRDDEAGDLRWTDVSLTAGAFRLSALAPGPYTLRPSSPDWNFGARAVPLREGRAEELTLAALGPRSVGDGTREWMPRRSPTFGLDPYAAQVVSKQLVTEADITSRLPGDLAVAGSGLTYEKAGYAALRIGGLTRSDRDATAIRRADEAVESTSRYRIPGVAPWRATAYAGRGVGGVRVLAQLLVKVRDTIWVADEKEFGTIDDGYVALPFNTGSHAEQVSIAWQVVFNPFNPWFLPEGQTSWAYVVPDAAPDASRPSLPSFEGGRRPGHTPAPITAAPPISVFSMRDSAWLGSLRTLRKRASEARETAEMEKRMMSDSGFRESFASGKGTAAASAALPATIEAAWSRVTGRVLPGPAVRSVQPPPVTVVPAKDTAPAKDARVADVKVTDTKVADPKVTDTKVADAGKEKEPGITEGEWLAKSATASRGRLDIAKPASASTPWSGGALLLWVGGGAGDRLVLRPEISVPGRYLMSGFFALGDGHCDVAITVNKTTVGGVKAVPGRESRSDKLVLGNVELVFGVNEIEIRLAGVATPNEKPGACSVGIDGFEFRPIK